MTNDRRLKTLRGRVEDALSRRGDETLQGIWQMARMLEAIQSDLQRDEVHDATVQAYETIVDQIEDAVSSLDVLATDLGLDGDPYFDREPELSQRMARSMEEAGSEG